jgi:hypothetical protein
VPIGVAEVRLDWILNSSSPLWWSGGALRLWTACDMTSLSSLESDVVPSFSRFLGRPGLTSFAFDRTSNKFIDLGMPEYFKPPHSPVAMQLPACLNEIMALTYCSSTLLQK